jgi:hypothetical protein
MCGASLPDAVKCHSRPGTIVPQVERPGFHEFLRLRGRAADRSLFEAGRGGNEVMRHSHNWVV